MKETGILVGMSNESACIAECMYAEKRMRVFVLQHVHSIDEEHEDIKLIGVYASQEAAKQAVARMQLQPGFCDTPEGFAISTITLNKDYWEEGYVTMDSSTESDAE